MMRMTTCVILLAAGYALCGCTHALQVTNLEMYASTFRVGGVSEKPTIAITPFNGRPEELFYFNCIVKRLAQDPGLGELRTDYIPQISRQDGFTPDAILTVSPRVTYRSSGWNFLINWPGFLIFTPAWHGYNYRADIMTTFTLRDIDGVNLDQFEIPVSYDIRHAAMNRTIFTGLTWLEVSALAFFSGIYNANVFDRGVIPPLRIQIDDNYSTYVLAQTQKRIRAAAAAGGRSTLPEVGAPPADEEQQSPPELPEATP